MASGQRAFAQRLSKQSNSDVRRQIAAAASGKGSTRGPGNVYIPSTVPLCEVVDPVDFEEFLIQHEEQLDRDPIRHLLDFPHDDIDVGILTRKCRTVAPIVPEEDSTTLDPHVKDCIRCYSSDSIVVNRRYQQFSSSYCLRDRSLEKIQVMRSTPKQEFEVDLEEEAALLKSGSLKTSPLHQPPLAQDEDTSDSSSCPSSNRQSLLLGDTPRGSWASSVFDLRNSLSDPLIPSLLARNPVEEVDRTNESRRKEHRQDALFALYAQQEEEAFIEKRLPAPMPREHLGHRILVKCLALKLELEMEPFFGSMALYDAKEKKKVSENFYFDMNPEPLKRMLVDHVPYHDVSTLSRSSIFNITWPSTDLFLVVKLEKVLQGDISECAEPYMKDDKNRDKVQSSAVNACRRLGKYRMPFAWTAIYLMNIVNGVNSLERDATLERESTGTNSLGRRGSLERKSGSEKRNSWSSDDFGQNLDSFPPVTLTVNSFFKQEGDKLRDEDLYKFLMDLKRPSSVVKRLKCIPGVLKLDISPCPEEAKYCLTPELVRLHPYPDEKGRPTKEVLEFPAKEVYVPHYVYRNLLYVCPKNLNFTNRPGSARNITCKVQFMSNEEPHTVLPVIFGKSSCPELTSEAMTAVTYHSKCPDFYDEVKIKLPAKLNNQHHLLFTFYHISCRQKADTKDTPIETPIGYTWLPILQNGRLQTGEHCLPVMVDKPPRDYSIRNPFVQIPNTKWVDNHKGLFSLVIDAVSSVYSQDPNVDNFLQMSLSIDDQNGLQQRLGSEGTSEEGRLKECILGVSAAKVEPLVQFLPVVLDRLVRLLVRPPVIAAQVVNISQTAFDTMAHVVASLSISLPHLNDMHGRNSLLASYVQFQCTLPHPEAMPMGAQSSSNLPLVVGLASPSSGVYGSLGRPMSLPAQRPYPTRSNSNPDLTSYLDSDAEVGLVMGRGLDRTASLRAPIQDGSMPGSPVYMGSRSQVRKIVHEELALQWVVSSGEARELALSYAWFFFELMAMSMSQHVATTDRMQYPRKMRFSQQFVDDITTLVTTITSELISRHMREETDLKMIQSLNRSLAFFLCDLLSIMNRGYVFSLIKTYCKQMSAKISSLPESAYLVCLKLDFLRIVCSHEHLVTLNLPFGTPLSPSPPTSPSPSIASSASSYTSTSTLTERGNYAELSQDFRQQHFLIGLVLADLATVLEVNNPAVHSKAINLVRNLLTCHDWDSRYAEPQVKARVATLYLPFLFIVMDTLPKLYDWHQECKARSLNSEDIHDSSFTQSVAMAIASSTVFPRNNQQSDSYDSYNQSSRFHLREDLTRHLLSCFLWVIKNVSEHTLQHCWADLSYHRLQQVLEVLFICVSCFEYKGKKSLRKYSQPILRKTSDIKTRLEESILGNLNARTEMMNRRKDRHPPSPASPMQADKLRWRKDQMQWKNFECPDRPKLEVETEAHIEGNLSTEANLIILDALELMIKVVNGNDSLQGLLSCALRVLLHSLGCNQSTFHLQNMFATQRALVFKFPELLFEEETEQCADLCLRLLRHCSSCISSIRAQASASLYLLMRQNFEIGNNFARVKMQVTMSLSSLVGRSQSFNEGFLRRSLKTILLYAEEDAELLETTFPEQVRDLVFNLYMILSDTVKMKEFQEDPEMLLDLMYRIAKGYQNSPDLRLTWLANMAQKHTEKQNHAEAAHCLVHSAGLVAEYLHMLEDRPYLPVGCVAFEKISGNVLEESAVSDDVLSPDEEGICTGKYFTENGLVGLLEQAAISFSQACLWEAMNEVYTILMPIAQAHRDYKKLANIHAKLHEAFTKIDQQSGKRVFGTYFRVGFYGSKFGDLDGEEFVYKEPTLTKLPEISSRLESFYCERFGDEFVEMIKDSNTVDPTKLNPDKAYIQITYVEPYFDMYEFKERVTSFDKNYNIRRFIYATPFTPDGRAHGELHEQYKRKTILGTVNTFPYVKTRVQVLERKQVVLTPIEVAIEDIQKKKSELAAATYQEPADPKILQMVLQGCIGTTVNQGPMEVAVVFLSDLLEGHKNPTASQNRLRICFKDFLKKCGDALRKNRSLIGPDQRDYQRELDRNYSSFKERILPMIDANNFAILRGRRTSQGASQSKHKTSPLI